MVSWSSSSLPFLSEPPRCGKFSIPAHKPQCPCKELGPKAPPFNQAFLAESHNSRQQRFKQCSGLMRTENLGNPAEYMLRRKTPNGTLDTSYDGVLRNWSIKTPAVKHIILPLPKDFNQTENSIHHYKIGSWWSEIKNRNGEDLDKVNDVKLYPKGEEKIKMPPRPITNEKLFFRNLESNKFRQCHNSTYCQKSQNTMPSQAYMISCSIDQCFSKQASPTDKFNCSPSLNNSLDSMKVKYNNLPQNYDSLRSVSDHKKCPFSSALSSEDLTIHNQDTYISNKLDEPWIQKKVFSWANMIYIELMTFLNSSQRGSKITNLSLQVKPYLNIHSNPGLPQQFRIQQEFMRWHNLPIIPQFLHGIGYDSKVQDHSNTPENLTNINFNSDEIPIEYPEKYQLKAPAYSIPYSTIPSHTHFTPVIHAKKAMEIIYLVCEQGGWHWIDGMLLGGCIAYGLKDFHEAINWFFKIISLDPNHVQANSNIATSFFCLNMRGEAEKYWLKSVKIQPYNFEAVEHMVGLLCSDNRGQEAVAFIEYVEKSIQPNIPGNHVEYSRESSSIADFELYKSEERVLDAVHYDVDHETKCSMTFCSRKERKRLLYPGFASRKHHNLSLENYQILSLIYAKGNILHGLGDIDGATRSFEDAILMSTGYAFNNIQDLINKIVECFSFEKINPFKSDYKSSSDVRAFMPLLLPPEKALQTASIILMRKCGSPCFHHLPQGTAKETAITITSNSLLSLAKIFQDSMSNSIFKPRSSIEPIELGDILALYYFSLSLQPSPSTANNIGILLANAHQSSTNPPITFRNQNSITPTIPGIVPGSNIAFALAYYYYGLELDPKHAHIYTNLGSLLKDIGQLAAAVTMYEKAVACDSSFDIALANLANAVKDQGRTHDAIGYFRRAVASSPDFPEAVCGLANSLNSVCDWTGRGGVNLDNGNQDKWHVDEAGMVVEGKKNYFGWGWMKRVVDIVAKQLDEGSHWGRGTLQDNSIHDFLHKLESADSADSWSPEKRQSFYAKLKSWSGNPWEGFRIIRLIERAMKRGMYRWYTDMYVKNQHFPSTHYPRPQVPRTLAVPSAPTVLPFHTFTCPLPAKDIRKISQLNALRISCSTLKSPWMQGTIFAPPKPPIPNLNIGYVSSDFNDHPLAHLMQSVFGMHNISRVKAFCYATSASDDSTHRQKIEREAPVFYDTSSWPAKRLIEQIIHDNIHILVNLNGYTRGARNEIFAARPAPIQMSFMGFAGTLGAEWCDYLLADEIVIPPDTLRSWRKNLSLEDQLICEEFNDDEGWVYSENVIFCRSTFFCCDHAQSSREKQSTWDQEQAMRWRMRKEIFPNLSDEAVILGNFNQLYKIEPTTFRSWLRILHQIPQAILWLLRFPDLGENNLRRTAREWAGEHVARRIWFSDVAPKKIHISRARVCDLFLDTPECNAHTTAADILWSSTPLLTLPRYRYKMCSRIAASILKSALPKSDDGRKAAQDLIAVDEDSYEKSAIALASKLHYRKTSQGYSEGIGRLSEIRKLLYDSRLNCALFDTKRWVSDLETAYEEAWRMWVAGEGGDIYLKHLIKESNDHFGL
ncbi:hypothetical protein GcM1_234019 [Golovinomyces cichoracearum]|uniref:protein O-GlcNAc transferase n=1 Tax=Golovinomyces cichoracearum TaxID=62708 RepID=A0A420IL85_9PEZI|nr:hypothetical protein GcM1_234019 [Golovinomyces cichoracearum]